MNELLELLVVVLMIAGLVALAARQVNRLAWYIENALSLVSASLILFAMLLVSAEVISRKGGAGFAVDYGFSKLVAIYLAVSGV